MAALQIENYVSPEEYLTRERTAGFKSEYYDGIIYAMSGASPPHNLIVTNVLRELSQQLRKTPCLVFPSDMKVRLPDSRKYFYPDVSVVCDAPVYADDRKDVLLNPLVIVEVLSESTAAFDRGEKFQSYQRIKSLQEYLLVSQDKMLIERFERRADDSWIYTKARGEDQSVTLATVACRLATGDVYDKVPLPEVVEDDGEEGEVLPS